MMDKTRLQDPADLPDAQHRQGSAGSCCQPFGRTTVALGRRQGVPGPRRGLRLHALPQEELLCGLLTATASWPPARALRLHCRLCSGVLPIASSAQPAPARSRSSRSRVARAASRSRASPTRTSSGAARRTACRADAGTGPRAVAGGPEARRPAPARRRSGGSISKRWLAAIGQRGDGPAGARRGRSTSPGLLVFVSFCACPTPRWPGWSTRPPAPRATLVLRGLGRRLAARHGTRASRRLIGKRKVGVPDRSAGLRPLLDLRHTDLRAPDARRRTSQRLCQPAQLRPGDRVSVRPPATSASTTRSSTSAFGARRSAAMPRSFLQR
ncbi:MAG: hypothetical protein MZW92_45075 [Comamonadaceae bacterium]|nr:hypothetical protein [Comamonadaceae bacterium]